MGADVVVHSVTKYIGGHSDIIGGAIMLNDKALYDRLFFVMKSMGTGMCAFDSWLAMRSSKTLEVRFLRAQSNAIAVANAMASHKNVQKMIFPGLKSHPQYELAKR
jgi:cystathionine gamma-lyase